jgi:NAD(P)-dependent dehydrogenase (short-subunit alcohol dehydrogenase family)
MSRPDAAAAPFDLTGHVAVITGGTSGIGLGMAEGLARAGADVSIWGRDEERNERARAQLAVHGTRVQALRCDVADGAQVERAFAATLRELGRVDSCFANAGVAPDGAGFLDLGVAEFRRVIATNLEGAFLTLRGAARHMVSRDGGGSLVGVASLSAIEGQARAQAYSASKGGLVSMIRSCAVELARYGIRANAILPGWIDTPMTDGSLTAAPLVAKVLPRIPVRRWGRPGDFAATAVYLASPGSAYHTGDALIVDGGYHAF